MKKKGDCIEQSRIARTPRHLRIQASAEIHPSLTRETRREANIT
jgi:hypothetical protein